MGLVKLSVKFSHWKAGNGPRVWYAPFLRVHVLLDTRKPLLAGYSPPHEGLAPVWIQFKYERVSRFCYLCGGLGHFQTICLKKRDGKEGCEKLGPWMKAESIPRRNPPRDTDNKAAPLILSSDNNMAKDAGSKRLGFQWFTESSGATEQAEIRSLTTHRLLLEGPQLTVD